MTPPLKVPGAVMAGLFLAVVLDTVVQISWKVAASGAPVDASVAAAAASVLRNKFFFLAMLGFVAQFYNWMSVLSRADLSYAQPVTALSYITVLAISKYALHESISKTRALGIALILVGVYFISRTAHSSARPEAS